MIKDILRFNKNKLNDRQLSDSLTVGDFLNEYAYSVQFSEDYLLPMASSIWSAEQKEILKMPINFLLNFFNNHGLLQIKDRPQWMVVSGGSREYIKKLSFSYKEKIVLNAKIESINRYKDFVTLKENNKTPENFDYVFIATHSDQALKMLNDPTDCEREVLSAIKYQDNEATLHTDSTLMPASKRAWAAWNYHLQDTGAGAGPVAVTYNMNILQGFDCDQQYCVTLNNSGAIDPHQVIARMHYQHPVYTPESVAAQGRQAEINGPMRTYYCGAYWRYGFHEDGVVSALDALEHFECSQGDRER
jgi:predicted NAD/FAD-binding protein